jgi:branched-chain amino acid transport system substrate-binding protein
MSMNRRSFLLAGAAAAGTTAMPLAAKAQFRNPYQQQFTIGVNAPLSGEGAAGGRQIAAGVQAAIDETNQYGGTFGSAFAMRTFDDMDALAQSIVNVQFAAADATILAMVGGYDGSLISASLTSYDNQQMPLIVPAATADSVTARSYRNVWRLPAKDSIEGQLAARFIAKRNKHKLAIAVFQTGDYGPSVAQGFLDGIRASGVQALAFTMPIDSPNYALAAKQLVDKSPDLIFLAGVTKDMGPLIPALRAAGYKGELGASQGFYNEEALKNYGGDFTAGVISTSFPPLQLAPDIANTLSDFKARYPVTALSAFSYAAAQIIMSAVRRSGANNRLSMMTALQTPATYDTIVGQFRFGPDGDPLDPVVYFYTVNDGKFKFLAPSHATPFIL